MKGYDSRTPHFREKVSGDHPAYKSTVAEPVMNAVDTMPAEYRHLVHDFGYVDVYRAWKRGMSPDSIRVSARNGVFAL
jgi:hypothetical protein